jgi:ribosomal protein S18 acetylase RimI-like enzyme
MVLSPRRTPDERFRVGESVIRVRPWPDDPTTAQIVPLTPGIQPHAAEIADLLDRLRRHGYEHVRTNALGPAERVTFATAGLDVIEELHLLRRSLHDPIPPPRLALRRPRSLREAVDVDRLAFPAGWRLDEDGLRDACNATPHHRIRVHGVPALGYAVHGRAGGNGFVQRLAVHPQVQRGGIGVALMLDGLRWLRRRRATDVLVNTQVGNERALALYLSLGFDVLDDRLQVLGGPLRGTWGRP